LSHLYALGPVGSSPVTPSCDCLAARCRDRHAGERAGLGAPGGWRVPAGPVGGHRPRVRRARRRGRVRRRLRSAHRVPGVGGLGDEAAPGAGPRRPGGERAGGPATATCPPRCTRRGAAGRSPSSPAPGVHRWSVHPWASGPRSNSRSSLAICPSGSRLNQVTPLRPPRRGRSRATGVASVPPTAPRPATRQRPPSSSRHSRSKPQPGAGPAPVRPSRRRSSRHPADISLHQDYRGHLRAVRRTSRHHPIKFSSP
jgi:hypothetical protein